MPNFEMVVPTRERAIELIDQHAPDSLKPLLKQCVRPAIALRIEKIDDAEIPTGASKFGGSPDVPADFEWPTWQDKPLGLLAQINLQEMAPFDVEGLLPRHGILLFFYEMEEMFVPDDEAQGTWRVLWIENGPLSRRQPPANIPPKNISAVPPGRIFAATELTTLDACDLDLSSEEYDAFTADFLPNFGRQKDIHRMLGNTENIQDSVLMVNEMRRLGVTKYHEHEAAILRGYADWLLLLQVQSDNHFPESWGDWGTLYFTIQREALLTRQFGETLFELQF
ncbi:DUF1963 domain-containing protein [bacterium]|nr:MAG: DUF1963 domain-containing protein [bacterium]